MGREENSIQSDVFGWLKLHGFYVWRNNNRPRKSYTFNGKKGSFDILGLCPCGKFLAVETKTKEGKLSEHQKEFLKEVTARHGKGVVARSLADVQGELSACLRCGWNTINHSTNYKCEHKD